MISILVVDYNISVHNALKEELSTNNITDVNLEYTKEFNLIDDGYDLIAINSEQISEIEFLVSLDCEQIIVYKAKPNLVIHEEKIEIIYEKEDPLYKILDLISNTRMKFIENNEVFISNNFFRELIINNSQPILIIDFKTLVEVDLMAIQNREDIYKLFDQIVILSNDSFHKLFEVENRNNMLKFWIAKFGFSKFELYRNELNKNLNEGGNNKFSFSFIDAKGVNKRVQTHFSKSIFSNGEKIVLTITIIKSDETDAEGITEKKNRLIEESILDIGDYAIIEDSINDLFYFDCSKIMNVCNVEFVKILELTKEGLILVSGKGWKKGYVGNYILPYYEESAFRSMLENFEIIIVENFDDESRFNIPDLISEHGIKSGVYCPIRQRGKVFGILAINNLSPSHYSDRVVSFLKTVGNILGSTLEQLFVTEQLIIGEEYYKTLFTNANEAIFTLNTDGIIIDVNAVGSQLLGYSRDDLIFKSIYSFTAEDWDDSITKNPFEYVQGRSEEYLGKVLDIKFRHKNESVIYTESILSLARYKENPFVTVIIRDISENYRQNFMLKVLSSSLNDILKAKSEKEVVKSVIGNLLNDNFICSWFNYVKYDYNNGYLITPLYFDIFKDKYKVNIFEILREQDEDKKENIDILFANNKSHVVKNIDKIPVYKKILDEMDLLGEYNMVILPIQVSKQPIGIFHIIYPSYFKLLEVELQIIDDLIQNISYAFSSLRILKQSKALVEQLELANIEFVKLLIALEKSSSMVLITDRNGDLEYVNNSFLEFTGYELNEVIGQNPKFLQFGQLNEAANEELWVHMSDRREWTGSFINKKKNGELYTVISSISPVLDEKDDIVNYVEIQQDITENQIMQEKVYRAQKMEAIGRLSQGIVHDFKNILSILMLNVEIIEDIVSEKGLIEEEVNAIKQTINRAREITSLLMSFSKEQEEKNISFSPISKCKETISWIKTVVGKNIVINLDVCYNNDLFFGNADKFNQLIVNLILNCRDAILKNGNIGIQLCSFEVKNNNIICGTNCSLFIEIKDILDKLIKDENDFIYIKIEDDGCGMTQNTLKRIFEPFFTTKESGTGIGLSVIYAYINSVGGKIEVQSEIDKGTVVRVIIPSVKHPRLVLET